MHLARKGWIACVLSAAFANTGGAQTGCQPAKSTPPQSVEEPVTPAIAPRVVREGYKTCITGLAKIEWGNAGVYQKSMIAALTFGSKVGMLKSSVRLAMGDNGVNDRFGMRVVMDLD